MPWISRAAALPAPGRSSAAAPQILQLFRGRTNPVDFPASIVSGLSSTDSTVQREAIAELRAYVRRLFFLDVGNYFQITNLVTTGIIAVIVIIGIPVIIHRFYHGRLHPFRLERRAQGSYLIPNAINCFLLLEGLYGILTIAFNLVVWQLFHNQQEHWVKLFQPFRSLVWIPLFCGAFLTGWGSLYTAPDTLDKPTASRNKTSAKGRLPWPLIVNLTCWGLPLLLIASLLPPVALASVRMADAFDEYKDWDRRFQNLVQETVANALVNQTAVNNFRSQAYSILTTWTRSYWYIDLGYVLWGFWAILFLVFYVPAGGVLVYLLYRQVDRQKAILLSCQRKLEAQLAQERQAEASRQTDETSPGFSSRLGVQPLALGHPYGGVSANNGASRGTAPLEDIYEDRGLSNDSRGTGPSDASASGKSGHDVMGLESALREAPTASYQVHGARTPGLASRPGHVASLAEEGEHPSSADGRPSTLQPGTPVTPSTFRTPSVFRRLMRIETSASSNRAGGQNSSARRRRISITGGPMSRYKYLRRCLVNLLILYFGIISAAACFGAVTIYLAAVEYELALKGPDSVSQSISVAGTTAAWVSAVFGTLTIGSIVFRNFDNPSPEASQGSGEDGGVRRRFARAAKTEASGAAGAGAGEKTRTLPAVPESVDLEASQMLQSRPQMAGDTSMKFMAGQGGFVIGPDDQLASMLSMGHEMEEPSRKVQRPPPAVRAWLGREREATMSIPQDVTESFGVVSVPMLPPSREEQFETNDTTLAEYPYDPRIKELPMGGQVKEMVPRKAVPVLDLASPSSAEQEVLRRQREAYESQQPATPVLTRQARLPEVHESPASKIAREWAEDQHEVLDTPATRGGATEARMPTRPSRDARRGGGWI